MADFLSECGRWDGKHRAPGVCQTVAAYPAVDHLGQRAAAACPHDQQVTGVSDRDQDPASLAPLDNRLHQQASGDLAPCRNERIAQSLFSVVRPDAAQVATACAPIGEITTGRHPGQGRYQGR